MSDLSPLRVGSASETVSPSRILQTGGFRGSRNMFDTFDHSAHTDPNSATSRNHKQEEE